MRNVTPLQPPLDRVTFSLHLPRHQNDFATTVTAVGTSELRRSHLWVISESWTRPSTNYDYDAATFLHHVALVSISDQPNTRAKLDAQMRGLDFAAEPWVEPHPQLPFG